MSSLACLFHWNVCYFVLLAVILALELCYEYFALLELLKYSVSCILTVKRSSAACWLLTVLPFQTHLYVEWLCTCVWKSAQASSLYALFVERLCSRKPVSRPGNVLRCYGRHMDDASIASVYRCPVLFPFLYHHLRCLIKMLKQYKLT